MKLAAKNRGAPNKSLKAFAALTGTVQTGAASHYRAGSACPLARRYVLAYQIYKLDTYSSKKA